MLKLVVLSFLVAYVYAAWYDEQEEYWVKKINSQNLPWKAGHNPYLKGKSKEQIMRLMGTKMDRRGLDTAPKVYHNVNKANIPQMFTAGVTSWAKCGTTIGYIKDQADCGSCWAVAASEVAEDRICIQNIASIGSSKMSQNRPAVIMSAAQLMDCCSYCGQGCQGGYPIDAMKWWSSTGFVTGGWYGSGCGCQPYQIPPCGPQGCSGPEANTPPCSNSCQSGYPLSYSQALNKASSYYQLAASVPTLQTEIMTNGPIECAFTVYANFMSYNHGIYNATQGGVMGGHAVKIIGWGYDKPSGFNYWLINNSWNTTWGLTGQFKFLMGSDLAGMESQCVAGMAKTGLNNYMLTCNK